MNTIALVAVTLAWRELDFTKRLRSDEVRFGIFDEKGREIGAYVEIGTFRDPARADERLVFSYTTRAGRQFGASFPRATVVASEEAAKKLAAKKIEAARKRAAKKFGGGS